MTRKLLYRFRRLVLVWKLRRLRDWLNFTQGLNSYLYTKYSITCGQIAKLDAAEMSKGRAEVIVR